jgi:hypothetical protein
MRRGVHRGVLSHGPLPTTPRGVATAMGPVPGRVLPALDALGIDVQGI